MADTIKQSKLCKDALDVAFEITKLVKFSPKRNAAFNCIKSSNEDDGTQASIGIRTLCPTRWTVRGELIKSILTNYKSLDEL